MLRRCGLAGLLLVLPIIIVFAGCSDNSTGSNRVTGDPDAPEFQSMKAAIGSAIDSTMSIMLRFAANPERVSPHLPWDTIPFYPDWGVVNPEDTLLHNYIDGWNIVYLGLATGVDYGRTVVDSARFYLADNTVDRYFSDLIKTMDFVHRQTDIYKGTGEGKQNSSAYVDVVFTDFASTSGGTINGTGKFVWDDYYETITGVIHDNYQFNATFEDVAFSQMVHKPWIPGTVTSGTITITATVSMNGTEQTWTIIVDFTVAGSVEITATNGNTDYSYEMTPTYE